VKALDASPCLRALQPHQLQQVHLRNREALPAAGHDQGGNDGQRERNLDLERRTQPGAGAQIDRAPDLLDVRLDHVHADAAARDVGDLLGGGKAGQED